MVPTRLVDNSGPLPKIAASLRAAGRVGRSLASAHSHALVAGQRLAQGPMNDNSPNTRKPGIAIYLRVSTQMQIAVGGGGGSLDNQEHRCRQYLASRGIDEAEVASAVVYREEARSGGSIEGRQRLELLRRRVRAGKVGLVIFTEISRLTRSLRDFLELTEEFRTHGCHWVSLREQQDTTTPSGRMLVAFTATLYQFERETLRERQKCAARARADRGLWYGGKYPFGYRVAGATLVPYEPEAAVVRQMYATYLETRSAAAVDQVLANCGLPDPPRARATVRDIMTNPVMCGIRMVTDAGPVAGTWPPIVPRETWQAVQDARAGRRTSGPRGKHWADTVLPRVNCVVCGFTFTASPFTDRKGHSYRYLRHAEGGCPHRRSVRVEALDELVTADLIALARNRAALSAWLAAVQAELEDQQAAKVAAARARVEELQAEAGRIWDRLRAVEDLPPSILDRARQLDRLAVEAEDLLAVAQNEAKECDVAKSVAKTRHAMIKLAAAWDGADHAAKTALIGELIRCVRVRLRSPAEEGDRIEEVVLDFCPRAGVSLTRRLR